LGYGRFSTLLRSGGGYGLRRLLRPVIIDVHRILRRLFCPAPGCPLQVDFAGLDCRRGVFDQHCRCGRGGKQGFSVPDV